MNGDLVNREASVPTAAERWRDCVEARLEEIAALRAALDTSLWDRIADRYGRIVAGSAERDPFLHRVMELVDPDTTVIDVGAGSGRFTLALAPHVHEVVAIDPSEGMLAVLEGELARQQIDNVRTMHGRLEDVDDVTGDVVICSFVVPFIADLAGFARGLSALGRRRVLIYMNAVSGDFLTEPFWRHFHGRARRPAPSYLDAAAVLEELGLQVDVEVVGAPLATRFPTMDDAMGHYLDLLVLPDDESTRAELASLLEPWLVQDGEVLRAPLRDLPAAILSWTPKHDAGEAGG
jgi:SAM-dependent methyltransferase